MANAELIEIFSAIQGEGPIVGRRQIFVRFGRCDVVCEYCDTPLCHVDLARARVETTPGVRDFAWIDNPVSTPRLLEAIAALDRPSGLHDSVSFTGGEPLLHAEVIAAACPVVRARGLETYLETNGHLIDALHRVIDGVDVVGMDIKLESTTGFAARFDENRRFLAVAAGRAREVFCKIVVGADTSDEELEQALAVVADVAPHAPVVLQPVTPFRGRGCPPTPDRLLTMHALAAARVRRPLVIPQTHKMLGQL